MSMTKMGIDIGQVKLGDIAEERVAQCGPQGHDNFTYIDISSIDRDTKRIVAPKVLQSSKAPSRAKQLLKTGDVVVSMTRPNLNAVAIVPPDLDGAIGSTGFHVLRARGAEPGFLFYAVQTPEFIDSMCQKVQGALYPAVRPRDISSFCISSTSPEHQRRIVAEIERQFTRLEAGVAALRRTQANLKRYRAAILKAACEGRLVPTEVELARTENRKTAIETGGALLTRILKERRQNWQGRGKYTEPALLDVANLPKLPTGWTWATIEQLTSLVATGATPYRGNPAYWKDGTIPWVTSGALNDTVVKIAKEFITLKAIEETNAKLFPQGTLLVALYGEGKTRGMVSELGIEAATNQACAALLFSGFNSESRPFLRIFMLNNYHAMRLLSMGGVQPNLSLSIVRQTAIPLPPLPEQTRIVAEVERRLSVIEELESMVSDNLQRATRLRQSILQKAFTGELVKP